MSVVNTFKTNKLEYSKENKIVLLNERSRAYISNPSAKHYAHDVFRYDIALILHNPPSSPVSMLYFFDLEKHEVLVMHPFATHCECAVMSFSMQDEIPMLSSIWIVHPLKLYDLMKEYPLFTDGYAAYLIDRVINS